MHRWRMFGLRGARIVHETRNSTSAIYGQMPKHRAVVSCCCSYAWPRCLAQLPVLLDLDRHVYTYDRFVPKLSSPMA